MAARTLRVLPFLFLTTRRAGMAIGIGVSRRKIGSSLSGSVASIQRCHFPKVGDIVNARCRPSDLAFAAHARAAALRQRNARADSLRETRLSLRHAGHGHGGVFGRKPRAPGAGGSDGGKHDAGDGVRDGAGSPRGSAVSPKVL